MRGRFIVFEGLDGSGKTTLIKKALERLPEKYIYNKGLNSKTKIGSFSAKHPSTLNFLAELAVNTYCIIKPALARGQDVLQDRYYFSVITHQNYGSICQRAIFHIAKRFLLEPDILFYLTVPEKERIRRLQLTSENPYHALLISDPSLVAQREEKYIRAFESFKGVKFRIDTTNQGIDGLVDDIISKLKRF